MANQTAIRIDQLTKDNYDTWKIHAEALLVKNNTWDYVCGNKTKPKQDDAEIKKWEQEDKKAKSDLILIISAPCLLDIKNCKTSHEVWKKLKEVHQSSGPAKKATLLKQLILNKMSDTEDVREHLSKFFDAVDKLQSMDLIINEELLSILMLYSLPDTYENFRAAIESRDNLPTPDVLKIKIIEEFESKESRSKSENGALYVKNRFNKTKQKFDERKNTEGKRFNSNIICYRCRQHGHPAFKCRTKFNNYEKKEKGDHSTATSSKTSSSSSRSTTFSVCEALYATSNKLSQMWCLDSGATSHMCHDIDKFSHLDHSKKSLLKLANNDSTEVKGVGIANIFSINYYNIKLENTLYAPDLRTNLLSVSKITEKGFKVIFKKEEALIIRQDGYILIKAKKINGLYYVLENNESAKLVKEKENSIMVWHNKFGHLNFKNLKNILKNESVLGTNCKNINENEIMQCDICIKGKMTRKPFIKNCITPRTSYPLELIHSDICGPMRNKSHGGSSYFVTFIDDFTRWSEVYFLKRKSDVLEAFTLFKNKAENFTGRKIKALRTDNGKEYCNKLFDKYLEDNGIIHQTTVEYTPQMNGIAERKNRTLIEMARCMLLQSKLKPIFWAEAISCANYIRNRCPSKAIKNNLPFTLWTNKRPNVKHFQIFGSPAYVLQNKPGKNKFEAKSKLLIFVGYDENNKVYRLWDSEERKIIRSRDVKFTKLKNGIEEKLKEVNENEILFNFDVEEDDIEGNINKDKVDKNENKNDKLDLKDDKLDLEDDKLDLKVPDELKRGPGRPRNLKTGKKGRPKKIYNTMTQNDSTDESSDDTFVDASYLVTLNNVKIDLSDPDNLKFWKEAMLEELSAHETNCTWKIIQRPMDRKVIKSRWVLQIKQDSKGNIKRQKARLVAKGCGQIYGVDYHETFAPVARHSSIRLLLTLAAHWNLKLHQLDFVTAYLNGDLEETIYMELPDYYYEIKNLKQEANKVCLLQKAIYGLKQSGRRWYLKLNEKLIQLGYISLESDPCIHVKFDINITIVMVYVDDIIIASDNQQCIEKFKEEMGLIFQMKDLGRLKYCLGIEFEQTEDGKIFMSQKKYIEDLLRKYRMEEANPVKTPMDCSMKLNKQMCPANKHEEEEASKLPFQSLIGSLIYLATVSRPDIAFCISKLSQYNNCYGKQHWLAAKRVLRYLKGTKDFELKFEKDNGNIIGFTDADWGSCEDDRRSYTGYIFKIGNTAVSWESRKQRTVALSTTEAEYMAISDASREALYLKQILTEFGYENNQCITIFNDNKGAHFMANNSVQNSRSKHIDIRHHFIRQVISNGEISIRYIDTNHMVADLFTKPLPAEKHWKCLKEIGLQNRN